MKLRYKCRRCEKVFYAGEDIPRQAMADLLRETIARGIAGRAGAPSGCASLLMAHGCDGEHESAKAFGIADLQGAS
jgi:hypothetical protein